MGIINATPDSFFDGGQYLQSSKAIEHGLRLYKEGAAILDIGGESSRPGSVAVEEQEELRRVKSVIEGLKNRVDAEISIDSRKAFVVEKALEAGADWINDICGFREAKMRILAAQSGAKCCVMHMHGEPETMQNKPLEEENAVEEVLLFFKKRIDELLRAGVSKEKIYLDPGIGFGKSAKANIKLLFAIPSFKALGFPVLIGLSHKSFLKKNLPLLDSLQASLLMNAFSIQQGADILRVHDVAATLAMR